MNRESSQNQTIQQELQAVGGLPLTHDKLFREVFQWHELAKAFLRSVLSVAIQEKLDIDRLTVEPKDFLSVIFKETRADMVYRVPIRDCDENLCIYVLLEHKSYNDFFTIFQADQYANQISQKEYQQTENEKRLTVDFRFSPVLVIIFHHGETSFTGPIDVANVYRDYGVLTDYLPRRRAILFDLSKLSESEIPDASETPELFAVLQIMREIFSMDIGTKSRVVLERLKPYSEIPKYRRLIRFLWYYLVSSARNLPKQELLTITEVVKKVIGEKEMPTVLEQLRAEGKAEGKAEGMTIGEARGEARGKAETILAILRGRFRKTSKSVEIAIRQMVDPIALDSWAVQAATCESLDEIEKSLL
jgi:predicted transposase/invertase (TIGR01784 family)